MLRWTKTTEIYVRPRGRLLAGFPKPMAGAFPFGQGRQVLLGSLWLDAPVSKPCLCQRS